MENLISEFIENNKQLQTKIRVANLGDLGFIQSADAFFNRLNSFCKQSADYYEDLGIGFSDSSIPRLTRKIRDNALQAKLLLMEAALNIVIDPSKTNVYRDRLRVILRSMEFLLSELNKEISENYDLFDSDLLICMNQ